MFKKLNAMNINIKSQIIQQENALAVMKSFLSSESKLTEKELFTIGCLVEGLSHGVGQVRSLLQQSSPLSRTHVPVQWLLGWGGGSGDEVLHPHGVRGSNGRLVPDVQVQGPCGAEGHFSEIKVKVIGEITGKFFFNSY